MIKTATLVAVCEGLGGLAVFSGALVNAGGWIRRRVAPANDGLRHATDFDIVPTWFEIVNDGHAVRLSVHAHAINHTLTAVTVISGQIPNFYLASGAIERIELVGHHTLPTRSTLDITFSRKLDTDEIALVQEASGDESVAAKLTFRADWRKWSRQRIYAQYTPELIRGAIRL